MNVLKVVLTTIVVLIVLMAILPTGRPNRSNESVAVANLRTINTAQVTYKSMEGSSGTYGTMTDLINARLLDDAFIGTKTGYNYTIRLDAAASVYTAEAMPASPQTGRYGYYSVPDAVVRYSTNASLAPRKMAGQPAQ